MSTLDAVREAKERLSLLPLSEVIVGLGVGKDEEGYFVSVNLSEESTEVERAARECAGDIRIKFRVTGVISAQ